MPLTLAQLARRLALPIRVDAGLDRPVPWAHSTELTDPTPFLEGGELLLTTGLALGPAEEYARRLADAGVVGLGFGTGLGHEVVPPELVGAAARHGLALLEVPRATPFIAVAKAVTRALADDEHAALVRADRAQRALTRAAVGRGGAAAVVRELARRVGAAVALLDAGGDPVHRVGDLPPLAEEVRRLGRGPAGGAWQAGDRHVAVQALGGRGYLAVAGDRPLDTADRTAVTAAASLLTLVLAHAADSAHARLSAELRAAQFRLLLAGQPVDGLPEPPFRVFLPHGGAAPTGWWAPVDGRVVVLARELDVPAAASTPVGPDEVARGYREALRAREAGVDRFEDVVGAGLLAPDAARFAEALLAPLDPVLRESLRVWLACHGQTDPAAARLGVHRHTVRNRLDRVERLLGRSLGAPGLRAELWLALHAEW